MAEVAKLTLSVMTADVGGFVGHVSSHPEVLDTAKERLYHAREKGAIVDYHILRCGDDLELVMAHRKGCDNIEIHELAWNVFMACREVAKELKLHEPGQCFDGQDFKGTLKNAGPGVAEIEFVERESEPVVILMANKAASGVWNMPLYRIFADPFNTPGLFTSPSMLGGFSLKVRDVDNGGELMVSLPQDIYHLLALVNSVHRFAILCEAYRNSDGEIAAVISSAMVHREGDKAGLRSEPAAIFRCHGGLPAVGEVMEPFAFPHLVQGCMMGAHMGPLMPVPFYEANPSRFDGPARVIGAGFQITNGRLVGPHDMFDDPGFDAARSKANSVTDYMRRHGPFQPGRAVQSDAALSGALEKFRERFKKSS